MLLDSFFTSRCTEFHKLRISNLFRANVTVLDTTMNTVVGTPIPVGTGPRGVGIGPCRAWRRPPSPPPRSPVCPGLDGARPQWADAVRGGAADGAPRD